METEGPTPVTFPPENVRDRQPKKQRQRGRAAQRGTHKASPEKAGVPEGEKTPGEGAQSSRTDPLETDEGEVRVDIRI